MLCRIDILAREEKSVRVIATRYAIGHHLGEVRQAAIRERERLNAPGYRVHDVHTAKEIEEVWESRD
jgi:hypothetical protein